MNLVEYRIVETRPGQYDLVPCAPTDEKHDLYDNVEEMMMEQRALLKNRQSLLKKEEDFAALIAAVECIKTEKQALASSPPVKRVKHRRRMRC